MDNVVYEIGAKIPVAKNLDNIIHSGVQVDEAFKLPMKKYFMDFEDKYVNNKIPDNVNILIIHERPKQVINLNQFGLIISNYDMNKLDFKKLSINLLDYGIPINKEIVLYIKSDIDIELSKEKAKPLSFYIENIADRDNHLIVRDWLFEKDMSGKFALISKLNKGNIHTLKGYIEDTDDIKIMQEDGKVRRLQPQELANILGYSYREYRTIVTPYLKRSKIKTLNNQIILDMFLKTLPKKIVSSIISSYINKKHQL